jgi:hypothetical protein
MRPHTLFSRRTLRLPGPRFRVAGVALALAAGLTVTAVSSAAASGTPQAAGQGAPPVAASANLAGATGSGLTAAAPPAASPPAADTTVMLPTGGRARAASTGNGSVQATPIPTGPADAAPSTFVRFTWDGDQYVIPDEAVPYVPSTLDPRLFDVSYLARAHLGTPGSAGIPVRITYTTATAASLPGVRLGRRTGDTASATITTAQAAGLGNLLAAQWHAARTGRSRVPVGELPGIRSITLAPPPGAPPLPASPAQASARPAAAGGLPYYALHLRVINLDGQPGEFCGFVQDVGNASLFEQLIGSVHHDPAVGSETLSVPEGTYSLMITVVTPDPSGTGFDSALVIKPQVTVDSNTSVTLDARTAVPYQVSISTPVSASLQTDDVGLSRTSITGGGTNTWAGFTSLAMDLYSQSPNPGLKDYADRLLVTPTTAVTKGSFLFDASTALSNTAVEGSSPQGRDPVYLLDFPHPGSVPSSLTYKVPVKDLTTMHEDLYGSAPCTSQGMEVGAESYLPLPGGVWEPNVLGEVQVPAGSRTDYLYSGDPGYELWEAFSGCVASGPPEIQDVIRQIGPGQQFTVVWNKGPNVPPPAAPPYANFENDPAGPRYTGDPRLTVCAACRQDDNGVVNLMPYGDSDPAHFTYLPDSHSLASSLVLFYRDGTLAFDSEHLSDFIPFGFYLPLLSQTATYQLDWAVASAPGASGTVDTDWTFRSGPDDPAARLPATEICAPDATQSCSLLPLLFLTYNLPLNYRDQAVAGSPEPIDFAVTGQQNAPLPAGVSATVSASFDGGKTWTTPQPATSLGGDHFSTTISQPALADTDGHVSLRVTATDGSGDAVTQTISDAYWLAS